jgi:uncharacterized RDD family membrane protein YckC
MNDRIEFETPENLKISYELAGLGTRFVAWFTDNIILGLILFVIFILLAVAGTGLTRVFETLLEPMEGVDPEKLHQLPMYTMGVFLLIAGLASFIYYGACELLMKGQTPGKRSLSIRVVKIDGFRLDAGSIFIRNIFRVIDHVPVVWVVPFLSSRSQRLGDMVAGTVIIKDKPRQMSSVRERLLQRGTEEATFSFNPATLKNAGQKDIEAAERILEKWNDLTIEQKNDLVPRICDSLAKHLHTDPPPPEQRLAFLEDFLASEYRRQHRQLG